MKVDRWIARSLVAAVIIAVAGGIFHAFYVQGLNLGEAKLQERQAKAEVAAARAETAAIKKREVEAAAEHATATQEAQAAARRFTATAASYESARDTLTVTDTAAVRVVLAKADSAIAEARAAQLKAERERNAARLLLAVKDERIGALERQNGALRRQIVAIERQRPGLFDRALTAGKWVAIGAVTGIVLTR